MMTCNRQIQCLERAKKLIILTLVTLGIGGVSEGAIAESQETENVQEFETFIDWCENRDNLTATAQHTVDMLLKETVKPVWMEGQQDCRMADEQLQSMTELHLGKDKIENLAPLSSLTSLAWLNLWENRVEDLAPLFSLTSLTWINFTNNPKLNYQTCPLQLEPDNCLFEHSKPTSPPTIFKRPVLFNHNRHLRKRGNGERGTGNSGKN